MFLNFKSYFAANDCFLDFAGDFPAVIWTVSAFGTEFIYIDFVFGVRVYDSDICLFAFPESAFVDSDYPRRADGH